MHTHSLDGWQHTHDFLGQAHDRNERRTWLVVALTASMMVAEIIGGHIYGSMALIADGWHMSTHAGALAIAAIAYRFARSHLHDPRFAFGTGKLGELAAFSSALILALIALIIGYESIVRLANPIAISFDEATAIAVIGLAVNILSALLLRDDHSHAHAHAHAHDHGHHHHDFNLRAAYLHVIADAMTSVLAIVALLAGRFYGWVWMDPVMGLVGAIVITHWSITLMRASAAVLVDAVPDPRMVGRIKERLEVEDDRVADLHVWRLGPGHVGVIAAIVSDRPQAPGIYKERLAGLQGLSHVTIEVHVCAHQQPQSGR